MTAIPRGPTVYRGGMAAISLWLALMIACAWIAVRGQYTADLSAFLPHDPTPAQQLLLDQLSDGIASRLILTGIEGGDATMRAGISKKMAIALRANASFANVNNGEPVSVERDRAYLFNNRYLLSPAVTPQRFEVEGLRAALGDSIDLIASPAGMMMRQLLPRDPTGELMRLLEQFDSGNRPQLTEGVWMSRDGARALLLLRTRALGFDIDAQAKAMASIQQAFDAARGGDSAIKMVMSGPGVFAVTSRETIQREVHQLSLMSSTIIIVMLLLVYRSVTALGLGVLPVVSGALAGVAAVMLGFGSVHGITLGFGTALIGEAVDYSIYLFVQSEQGGAHTQDWVQRFWPTVRLGVLTSIFGFASLLLSGFPGLAQLGLYAISGLVVAAMVTRFVLPHLLPANFRIHDVSAIGQALLGLVNRAAALRWLVALVLIAACAVLVTHRATLWNTSLGSLSPLRDADVAHDAGLRADLGAPDARYLVAVSGPTREAVLQSAEKVSAALQALVEQGDLAAFESPSRFLPSEAAQRARLASLPPPNELAARVAEAVKGQPIGAAKLTPFLADVERTRQQGLIKAADLELTSMTMAVDALLTQKRSHWSALLPLTAPTGGIQAERVRAALDKAAVPNTLFVDIKAESDQVYSGYLHEAIVLSLGGLAALILLLAVTLRSASRVARVVAPLAAAVLTVAAGLVLCGLQLTILHLVGLLLVVAVGSNYALFFDRADARALIAQTIAPRTLASMLLANATTVAGFGLLAFSNVSILQAVGSTVAPGVMLALVYAAVFARKNHG